MTPDLDKLRADVAWHREQAERIERYLADQAAATSVEGAIGYGEVAQALGITKKAAQGRVGRLARRQNIGTRWDHVTGRTVFNPTVLKQLSRRNGGDAPC